MWWKQKELFAIQPTTAYARTGDPETSQDAARKIKFTKTEQAVLEVFTSRPSKSMTSLCVARILQVDPWSVSPRFKPLEDKGVIERCGKMMVVNSNGNPASLTAWKYRVRT